MAVLGCGFCGNRMYYHGEPEDNIPMEHYFCPIEKWHEFERNNWDLLENWKEFTES